MNSKKSIYQKRRERVYQYLKKQRIDAAVISDTEGMRNSSIRYLTGHPFDAVLVLANGNSVLIPWDINIAEQIAQADKIIPYSSFNRDFVKIIKNIGELAALKPDKNPAVEITGAAPYTLIEKIKSAVPSYHIYCRENGIDSFLLELRMIKDTEEIGLLRKASEITDKIIESLKDFLVKNPESTETDIALFLEGRARALGAEATAFESLIAGAGRSFAIHAFPSYTSAQFIDSGIFLIDFGVRYNGYGSDVTVPFIKKPLLPLQKRMADTVIEVYKNATEHIEAGSSILKTAQKADLLFKKHNFAMPHSLGHGIGLDVHEAPYVSSQKTDPEIKFKNGMVFTIEPGLYNINAGGIRLENDFVIIKNNVEALTHSHLIEL